METECLSRPAQPSALRDAAAAPTHVAPFRERVLGGARAAAGQGLGYEAQPVGEHFADAPLRGYFIDFRAKTTARTAATPSDLSPAALAQLALGWWERAVSGEPDVLPRFVGTAELLRRRHNHALWAYQHDLPKYGLRAPWYSAMAQGQAASVFARAARLSDDAADADLAISALRPLLRRTTSGLVVQTPEGPVLEEAPSVRPSRILNGWIFALIGLWDVGEGLDDADSARAFGVGIAALERSLPLYDVGWWSRYSLYPHRLTDLAKPFYHRLHVAQLDALHRMLGIDAFAKTSRRWASHDRALPRSCALTQKAAFRLLRGSSA
jgi:heparosan-N-sulfate-glucuronate 5-epimerase